jgi:hypothetical protein
MRPARSGWWTSAASQRRLAAIQAHVRRHDVEAWIAALLADADRAAERRTMGP